MTVDSRITAGGRLAAATIVASGIWGSQSVGFHPQLNAVTTIVVENIVIANAEFVDCFEVDPANPAKRLGQVAIQG